MFDKYNTKYNNKKIWYPQDLISDHDIYKNNSEGLKRCLTEEKSRAHSAFKLAQIKQKPKENLRIFILRYQDLHAAATGKTAAEDTDPTHIIRFLGMMTNSEIARKITQKEIPEGMTFGQAFTRAIELEAGYQLLEG